MKRYLFVAVAAALFAMPSLRASAEVEKFMRVCDGQACPYFRLKFTPPKNWVQDVKATRENGLAIYVPKGKDFGSADALIYIRVSYNNDKRSMQTFIDVAHQRWRADVHDTRIDRVASEKRQNGKPDFQVYHFENPGRPEQAYEMIAYGEDRDRDGNDFFLMIALTGASQKALDDAEGAYRAALRAH